ncbi:terminal flower 1-like protein-like protein [Lojkania enalia]|uniref:Terminal flower 1-like protein-like protein n=1 Tax=Lojkania enalia TaxID=147567 RepID=A0A9P4TQX6_9PLEO|nr:terminal flower 1-like protein-like protein [Didymosphaeria enalia]
MLVPLIAFLQLWGTATALPTEQKPLKDLKSSNALKVQAKLKKAEIIPTVIDDFLPSVSLSVSWKKDSASLGNTIKPKRLQKQPSITIHNETNHAASNMTYIVTLTDPDAPSRDNPEWSEMCHWIAANVSLSAKTYLILPIDDLVTEQEEVNRTQDNVIEYKPPGPPPKTGKHRYVFLVFAPQNGTTDPLNLSKPKDRQHWGTGIEGGGVREWAESNGLNVVGANFIYSQHKKQ